MVKSAARKVATPRAVPEDLAAVVLEAVNAVPSIKAAQLKKALPKSYQPFDKEARALAQRLAQQGKIFRWAKGKQEFFFARDPAVTVDQVIRLGISAAPIDQAGLKVLLEEKAPGHEGLVAEWLSHAVARGLLFVHPPLKPRAKKRYGLKPPAPPEPDVRASLKAVLKALRTALAKTDQQGISRQRVAEVLVAELGLSPDGRLEFLSALSKLTADNPGQALLSVRDLRARSGLDKQRFDTLALELSREGVISLHHHDHPASLSEVERSQLVSDTGGTHYIGIAPRRA